MTFAYRLVVREAGRGMARHRRSGIWPPYLEFGLVVIYITTLCPQVCRSADTVLYAHEDNVYALALSADGTKLVSASGDGHAIVWDMALRKASHDMLHAAPVYDARFAHDGRVITVSGDGKTSWWNDGALERQEQAHRHAVYSLAVSPMADLLATGGGETDGGDTALRLWSLGEPRVSQVLPGHVRPIYGIAISPDGKTVATSGGDKLIRLWRPGQVDSTILQGHQSDVYRSAFSRDGLRLVSSSQDGTVRIWDVRQGQALAEWKVSRDPVYAVAISNDDDRIASVAGDGHARIHMWPDGTLALDEQASGDSLYTVIWAPDQQALIIGGADGEIRILPGT